MNGSCLLLVAFRTSSRTKPNALRRSNGNVSLAARTVGVTRPTFYDMMRKTGIYIRTEAKV